MDSKTVFELRNEAKYLSGIDKLNVLNNALSIARNLYLEEQYDEWNQKAFAWVLIDLCKYYIADNNLNQAQDCFKKLNIIDFQGHEDEIIEKQKNFLRPKIDTNYYEIQKAEELSKNGNNKEALAIFKDLISQNRLSELQHESYGWVIYRYIKAEESNLSSIEVRTFLRNYMNLRNERPSVLHSMILNFALNYSKTHNDFRFYDFFVKWWKLENLRYEDLRDVTKQNGDRIPSLISRICREFVNSNTIFNIEEFLNEIDLNKEIVLDFFRKPYFHNIFNIQKENKLSELWKLFENYNTHYSKYGKSKYHSEILNLAERFMKENEEWRFLIFFKNWNPKNFRDEDWKETINGENTYKPLATKSIKKIFDVLKKDDTEQDLSWLIETYENAVNKLPDDEWLLREKALLHLRNKELNSAIRIYKKLVLELGNKHYIWQEFSNCFYSDNQLKIGMLSKALDLEKNENFLGDIHLELARLLINEDFLENALMELDIYKKHRECKGWRLSQEYEELLSKVGKTESNLKNNKDLYNKYIPLAENFAYSNFTWQEVVLVDKWKDEKGKERLSFNDGKSIDFQISKNRFNILKQFELGQVFKFKLHKQEVKKEVDGKFVEHKYIPLLVEKSDKEVWSILQDTYAVVDYFNKEKNIIHAITFDNKAIFFLQLKKELQIGDFITSKFYTRKIKEETRIEIRQIQRVTKNKVISKFKNQIAIVDGVNEQKLLFHFVINPKLKGIIKYSETNLRPNEGNFLKLSFVTKIDKEKRLRIKVLNIEPTDEVNQNLRKDVIGLLKLKYKFQDLDNEDTEETLPSFGFVEDYYIPKSLLEKHNILFDCQVKATVIYAGDKWKVIEIKKYEL